MKKIKMKKIILLILVMALSCAALSFDVSAISLYNYVYDGSSWVPMLSTADGQQKLWIEMKNCSYGRVQNDLYVVGNVGIGTMTPGEELYVVGSINVTSGNDICIEGDKCLSEAGTGVGDITAVGSMASGDAFAGAAATGDWLGLGSGAGRIAFDDQAIDYVNILDANIGIGSTAPNAVLEVKGGVNISGELNVSGDLAFNSIDGNTLIVSPNSAYTTITLAMAAAAAGDTILVAEGTYTETVTFSQDNITLKAIGSKENTIITQAADIAVDFSTKSGCVLEGFTITVTAADAAADNTVKSANDDASDYNYLINCDVNWTSASQLNAHYPVIITDGNFEIRDCKITTDMNYAGDGANAGNTVYSTADTHTLKVIHSELYYDTETGDMNSAEVIRVNPATSAILWLIDSKLDGEAEFTLAGNFDGLYLVKTTAHLLNNYIEVDADSTALCRGISTSTSGTTNSYNNVIDSSNSDGDSNWAIVGASTTLNSYGDTIIGGTLSNAGTFIAHKWTGVVTTETDETKFSHKMAVTIEGSPYYVMLTDS